MTEYQLLTLDVFDTCLIREFVSQESLWYLLGRQLRDELPGISGPAQFARLRGQAEDAARGASAAEDIRLADVYARLGARCGWNPRQQRYAVASEEDLEFRGLRANPAAGPLLALAGSLRVCYLTDTPHRSSFIRACLDAQDMPAGPVLSSGDLGQRKGTGALFAVASKRLGVRPRQILHAGNDVRTDGGGSAAAGVAFAPVPDANPSRYELALDTATRESGGLLGAVLGGAGRDFRLAEAGQPGEALAPVVAGVAGPSIVAAAAWTLLSAQRDDVGTLYFVARDGEILLAVARLLQRELGLAAGIDCRYLHGSRQAWHLPALTLTADPDPAAVLRRHLLRSRKQTVRGLLAQVGIDPDEAAGLAGTVTAKSLDAPLGGRLTAVVDGLAGAPEFQALALSRAKQAHEATVGYLSQQGMLGGGRAGLVDIGWHGAASASLVALAAAQGTEVRCYFAGGLCGHESSAAPPDSSAFLVDARSEEPEVRPALVHLLESFCAGTGGSTLGYTMGDDGRYVPLLAPAGSNAALEWGLRAYQDQVCRYAVRASQGLAKLAWDATLDEVEGLRPYLLANLRTLWNYPTSAEAARWGSFPFEGDSGTGVLARAVTWRDIAGYVRSAGNPGRRPRFGPWQRAVIARTVGGGRLADPLAALQIMTPAGRPLVRARVRSRVARRPVVRLSALTAVNSALDSAVSSKRKRR